MPSFDTQQNKFFAECQTGGTRQRECRWMPLGPYQSLPSVCLCRVPAFAECRSGHSAKASLPSVIFCRVRRSAKQVFAEWPKFGTRQRFLHSANHVFPVVLDAYIYSRPLIGDPLRNPNLKWVSNIIHIASNRVSIWKIHFRCQERHNPNLYILSPGDPAERVVF